MRTQPPVDIWKQCLKNKSAALLFFQICLIFSFGFNYSVIVQSVYMLNVSSDNTSQINITHTEVEALLSLYMPSMDGVMAVFLNFLFVLQFKLPALVKDENDLKDLKAFLIAGLILMPIAMVGIETTLFALPNLMSLINDNREEQLLFNDINKKQMYYAIVLVAKTYLEQYYFAIEKYWITALSTLISIVGATCLLDANKFETFTDALVMPFVYAELSLVVVYSLGLLCVNPRLFYSEKPSCSMIGQEFCFLWKNVWPLLMNESLNVLLPIIHAVLALSMGSEVAANTQQFYRWYYFLYLTLMSASVLVEIKVSQLGDDMDVTKIKNLVHTIMFNAFALTLLVIVVVSIYTYLKAMPEDMAIFIFGMMFAVSELFKRVFISSLRVMDHNKKVSFIATSGLIVSITTMIAINYLMQQSSVANQSYALLAAPFILSLLSMIVFGCMFHQYTYTENEATNTNDNAARLSHPEESPVAPQTNLAASALPANYYLLPG